MYIRGQVGRAMQRMHDRKNIGKVILSPMKEPEPAPPPQERRKSKKEHKAKPKAEVSCDFILCLELSWRKTGTVHYKSRLDHLNTVKVNDSTFFRKWNKSLNQ